MASQLRRLFLPLLCCCLALCSLHPPFPCFQVWDQDTCRLRKDLPHQARDELMMHDEAVLCMSFSRDAELLATGARDGRVKVWQVRSGACVRRFNGAHAEAVSAVCFTRDASQVLSGGFDSLLRLHGLKVRRG